MRPVVRSRVRRVLAAAGIPLLLGAVLGAVLGLTLVVSPASAHTDLVSATPSSGSTLDGVPAGVELGFATSVQARLTQVVVSDTDGRDHVVGPVASFDTRVEARGRAATPWPIASSPPTATPWSGGTPSSWPRVPRPPRRPQAPCPAARHLPRRPAGRGWHRCWADWRSPWWSCCASAMQDDG
jgi:hypothetical protein